MAFPAGYRWGTDTAAHQVGGGSGNNDWRAWEQDLGSGCSQPSGDACTGLLPLTPRSLGSDR